jgi:GNAT superfamily N-acetyltransferase
VSSHPQPPLDTVGLRHRILEELRRTLRSLAEEERPVGPGWAVRTRSLPLVWTLNQLRLVRPAEPLDVVSLADEHQADLPYRHLVVEEETTGRRLEDLLGHHGWKVDHEVLMALMDIPDREVDQQVTVELDEPQMLGLMRRWDIEEHPGISEEALDQLLEYCRREGRLWNERCFGVLDDSGKPVALTKLRSHETTAWVEDVYTVAEARRRGHARMLVSRATGLARSEEHDLTFIMADDDDWPKHLYAAIGFRPVGVIRTFHRDLDRDAGRV